MAVLSGRTDVLLEKHLINISESCTGLRLMQAPPLLSFGFDAHC